ncbi:hypothetical protein GNI_105650 [Gregarina niphandrodes]|uniref:Uncharacterized protein n=1 Tax=Gregarina niphandrodes TaxID=110365 RepID=A0A023B3Y2_GRENI|nr:hypothetical protein GNI_105650 [Gregarina niphandrodes]EZG56105.1 hypothetical protein GNI_105650 [Gregarina niphandrodes]|eukprot:XP_011131338.1 hypothetical protein GNI_105650 [Gregarina niphandrodes]
MSGPTKGKQLKFTSQNQTLYYTEKPLRQSLVSRLRLNGGVLKESITKEAFVSALIQRLKLKGSTEQYEKLFDEVVQRRRVSGDRVEWEQLVDSLLNHRAQFVGEYHRALEDYRNVQMMGEKAVKELSEGERMGDHRLVIHLQSLTFDYGESEDGDLLSSSAMLYQLEVELLDSHDVQESDLVKAQKHCIFNEFMTFPLATPSAVLRFKLMREPATAIDPQQREICGSGEQSLKNLQNMIPLIFDNVPIDASDNGVAHLAFSALWQFDREAYYRSVLSSLDSRLNALHVAVQVQQSNVDELDKQLFGYPVENTKWTHVLLSPNAAMDASVSLMQRIAKRDINDSIQVGLIITLMISCISQFARGSFIETLVLLTCIWHNNGTTTLLTLSYYPLPTLSYYPLHTRAYYPLPTRAYYPLPTRAYYPYGTTTHTVNMFFPLRTSNTLDQKELPKLYSCPFNSPIQKLVQFSIQQKLQHLSV